MKINYLFIPALAAFVAWVGGSITSGGMEEWYNTLTLPSITPPGAFIGAVWTILYILTAISAIIVYNQGFRDTAWLLTVGMFILNAFLNIFWSYLFFGQHLLGLAVLEAGLLGLSVLLIIIFSWPISRLAALLLVPYLAWVSFATYLAYLIYRLNP